MPALFSFKKYILLAISGAVIIGVGTFFLINSYFEKTGIAVAKTDIAAGRIIEEKDISFIQYYKESLPSGYITDKDMIIGKAAAIQRQVNDPITSSVIEKATEKDPADTLDEGELLFALSIPSGEPLISQLKAGSRITIISTEQEKYERTSYKGPDISSGDEENPVLPGSSDYLDLNSYILSESITIIDGQLIIMNLEVAEVRVPEDNSEDLLINSGKNTGSILLKCGLKEASILSRVTKDENYKIFLEKM